jgi:hypothetical protein
VTAPFTPLSLFASGAQGVWYDDGDMSTMFQDSAGTTPVTAVEQPVGRQLDLSGNNNHRTQATSANRPTLSARYNLLTATATLATQSITTVATNYTITFTGAGTVTLSGTYVGVFSAGTNTFTATAGTLTVTVVGSVLTADIRPTNQTVTLPSYQAVTSSTVYDTVGFPQYLRYNGSSSSLSTSAVDFTATAQMNVFIGIRKLNDASLSLVVENTAGTLFNGTFSIFAPSPAGANIGFGLSSSGSVFQTGAANPFASPITTVCASSYDFTQTTNATRIVGRVNGVNQTLSFTGSGTIANINFANYPLFFGARAGNSFRFTGQEYQTIIVGKALTATEIANTETYVNSKTKAYA